jgi:pectin methylesterase-like acyl-CoA thioesterase
MIIGILYDSNTPYVWTQEMRNGFKNTNLLTNQGTFHGIGGNDPSCQRHVRDYLTNGYVSYNDGHVCGADFASFDNFLSVFGFARR